MPVSDNTPYFNVIAHGGNSYPFNFKIFQPEDLVVTVAGEVKVLGVDYTVVITADPGEGGTVVFQPGYIPAVDLGAVEISRQLTRDRTTDYQEAGGFRQAVVDKDFDRLTMMLQEVDAHASRSIKMPFSAAGDFTLPNGPRAGTFLAFDANGMPTLFLPPAVPFDPIFEVVQPEMHGAKGDGETNDTDEIIAALLAGAGKTVIFKAGRTYCVDGRLLKFYSGTTIHMYGATFKLLPGHYPESTYFFGNSTTISWPSAEPEVSNVRIFGGTLDGNLPNVTTDKGCTGGHVYKMNNFAMVDVTIKDLAGDIGVGYGFITSMSANVFLERCYFGRTPRSNAYLWESRNCHVVNCIFEGSHYRDCISVGTNGGDGEPVAYQATSFTIRGCRLRNTLATSTHVIRCSGNVYGVIEGCHIDGYLADDGGGSGAEAVATVVGGSVTSVVAKPGKEGVGYISPAHVRINGAGGRIAQVRSVVNPDGSLSYVVDDGGSGYDDTVGEDPADPPNVYVGQGTEGLYFTNTLGQFVRITDVWISRAHYGVLVESEGVKHLEFNNLQIGISGDVRNGFQSTASGADLKIVGGTLKATKRPLYIGFSPSFTVTGVDVLGGDTASSLLPMVGGTAVIMGNTISGNTSASYAMLVGGDVGSAPLVACNTVAGNTINQIRMTQGGRAVGNTPGVINTTTAVTDQVGSGGSNPVTAPLAFGQRFYNTVTRRLLFAKGTAASSDWIDPALKGTLTNDNAAVGDIGEFFSALVPVGGAAGLITNTGHSVASLPLGAGDWDVEGNVNLMAAGATITAMSAGISLAAATVPVDGSEVYAGQQTVVTNMTTSITLPRKRINLAAPTTIYLVTQATFSAGVLSAFGSINARRVR